MTGYLSTSPAQDEPKILEDQEREQLPETSEEASQEKSTLPPVIDFTLTDQYGNTHTLSDYKGKTVFLNFWATWCPPCRTEMPDIQKIYDSSQENEDDSLVILGVAGPAQGQEISVEGIKEFGIVK